MAVTSGRRAPAIQNPAYRPAGVTSALRSNSIPSGSHPRRTRPFFKPRKGDDAARRQSHPRRPMVRRAGRHGGARFRRALSPALRHDRRRRPRFPPRPRGSRDAARRRRFETRGRTHCRSGRGARAAGGDPGRRRAGPDTRRLASRQSPSADRTHAEGAARPPRSRHRGDGRGPGGPGHSARGAVQPRRGRIREGRGERGEPA